MKLRTECHKCIFKSKSDTGCALNHIVFDELDDRDQDKQYTEGFCSYKRTPHWMKKNEYPEDIIPMIQEENRHLSIIIIDDGDDEDFDSIRTTIGSLQLASKGSDIIKQLIIVCSKKAPLSVDNNVNDRWQKLVSGVEYSYHIENIKEKQGLNGELII